MAKRLAGVIAAAAVLAAVAGPHTTSRAAPALDYDFFKTRVQMVFLEKRPTHTRCYICHAESNNGFHLERLASGETFWTEEQSRKNFEMASRLVNPGDPDTSRLLLHPLAPESGGDVYHSGGRQFPSKSDPAWRTLAAWINGATLASPKK